MCETWRCYRLCELMVKRMELDDAMNWLSTLGGAYSALGDYFVHHVCSLWPYFVLFLLTSMTLSSCVYYWKVELKMINTNHQRRLHLHHFTKFRWSQAIHYCVFKLGTMCSHGVDQKLIFTIPPPPGTHIATAYQISTHSAMHCVVDDLQCVSKKNIPNIFSCNFRNHYRIFIMFGTHVTEKVSNQ